MRLDLNVVVGLEMLESEEILKSLASLERGCL